MYAVIQTGGKQYKVDPGSTLKIEKIDAQIGDEWVFDRVLMINDGEQTEFGQPFIEGRRVIAKVKSQGRAKKIRILKFRRRKHHMKRQGHRQYYTEVEITGIE